MNESNYLTKVASAKAAAGEGGFILPGGLLLVERLPTREIKTKSGLIIADNSKHQANTMMANTPVEVIVVAVGEGYSSDPLDSVCGDILIVGDNAVKWLSTFPIDGYEPNSLGICGEENTQVRFRGREAYAAFEAGSCQTEEKPE